MSNNKKFEYPIFLYWPDLPRSATVLVIKTKRKTIEVSMNHNMEIILRVPLDTSIEDIRMLVGKHSENFKHHALITALRDISE